MNPFADSDIWKTLPASKRRRVAAAITVSEQTWYRFLIPSKTTGHEVATFARANLLRGFFEQPSRIVTAVVARRVPAGVELRIACSPHPLNVALPAWGCGMLNALKLTFGEVVAMGTANRENVG